MYIETAIILKLFIVLANVQNRMLVKKRSCAEISEKSTVEYLLTFLQEDLIGMSHEK